MFTSAPPQCHLARRWRRGRRWRAWEHSSCRLGAKFTLLAEWLQNGIENMNALGIWGKHWRDGTRQNTRSNLIAVSNVTAVTTDTSHPQAFFAPEIAFRWLRNHHQTLSARHIPSMRAKPHRKFHSSIPGTENRFQFASVDQLMKNWLEFHWKLFEWWSNMSQERCTTHHRISKHDASPIETEVVLCRFIRFRQRTDNAPTTNQFRNIFQFLTKTPMTMRKLFTHDGCYQLLPFQLYFRNRFEGCAPFGIRLSLASCWWLSFDDGVILKEMIFWLN